MRYKAVLIGALVPPAGNKKGVPVPWQIFRQTERECVEAGQAVLERLSAELQKVARVEVMEDKWERVAEIHVAAVQPKEGPTVFAIARF